MPTNVYQQRCLTCMHPVDPENPDIGLIKMANQPRYYHITAEGCQQAEHGRDYFSPGKRNYGKDDFWLDQEIHAREKLEKTGMLVAE